MTARYKRTLNGEVTHVVTKGGAWHFLFADVPSLSEDRYALDVQLREDNEIMYYHGTTRILSVQFFQSAKTGQWMVTADADAAYGRYEACSQQYLALMKKDWPLSEASAFKKAWRIYLKAALAGVHAKYYGNRREGYWQNRLCIQFGPRWLPSDEWLVIDRECVIGFDNRDEKKKSYMEETQKALAIRRELQGAEPRKWGKPDDKGFGNELDMLAINRQGELVVIELKHAENPDGIYWGPLQVGVYHYAFKRNWPEIKEQIRDLALQKIALGLLPISARPQVKEASLALGAPVLVIAEPKAASCCWGKMLNVHERAKSYGDLGLKVALCWTQGENMELSNCEADEHPLRALLNKKGAV